MSLFFCHLLPGFYHSLVLLLPPAQCSTNHMPVPNSALRMSNTLTAGSASYWWCLLWLVCAESCYVHICCAALLQSILGWLLHLLCAQYCLRWEHEDWCGTVLCVLLCVLQRYGHKERWCLCGEETQWCTDVRGCTYSREASQQHSAIKYLLDCPCPLLLTHYLPFFGMDNQNYTVFCSIFIMFVWIVYVCCFKCWAVLPKRMFTVTFLFFKTYAPILHQQEVNIISASSCFVFSTIMIWARITQLMQWLTCGLDDPGFNFWQGQEFGVHAASCWWIPEVNQPGHAADHTPI
jgi:hypothetical protein